MHSGVSEIGLSDVEDEVEEEGELPNSGKLFVRTPLSATDILSLLYNVSSLYVAAAATRSY